MSARKLGRFAGLVFVLAAVFGGVTATGIGQAHTGPAATTATDATSLSLEWD